MASRKTSAAEALRDWFLRLMCASSIIALSLSGSSSKYSKEKKSAIVPKKSSYFERFMFEKLKRWFSENLVKPLKIMSGPERFILIFIGIWFGVFPIPGLSTPTLLFAFILINRCQKPTLSVSETSVAAAINILSTPLCILLLPAWMMAGSRMFGLNDRCKALQIIKELFVNQTLAFYILLVTIQAFLTL
jgi:hypothetical protein